MSKVRGQSSQSSDHEGDPGNHAHSTHHRQHKHHGETWYVGWGMVGATALGLGAFAVHVYPEFKKPDAAWVGQYAGHLGCLTRTGFNPGHGGSVGNMHKEEVLGQEREVIDVNSGRLSDHPSVLKFVVNEHLLSGDHFLDAPTFGSADQATHDYLEKMDVPPRVCPDDNR